MNDPDAPPSPSTEAPAAADRAAGVPSRSALGPLREPVFRMLWLAWLAANVTMWMNDVAAAWLMTSLTDSVVMVALVQAASTLPVFVLGLPSGALADIVDRRRYFAITQLWVALVAVVLCATAMAGALSAPLLLALTFANGIAMNMSRVIGPVVAGALLAGAGSPWVFLINALLSLAAFALILRWRSQRKASALPGERFIGAMRVGLQHVQQSPRMRAVLGRIFLFFLQSTALTALLPLVARRLGGGAGTFTLLLGAMGVGAITAALFLLPRLRERLGRDEMVRWGTVIHAMATMVVAWSPTVWLTVPAMVVAGMVWLSVANSLTVAAQMALPDWVRARGMSIYQMALMGGSASGAALWGYVAGQTSVPASLVSAAIVGPVLLLATRRLSVGTAVDEDLSPARASGMVAPPVVDIRPDEGPVMVTVEYQIDPARAQDFAAVMRETRQARLRQGALSWGLFRDTAVVGRYIEYFVDESWVEHQRRLERFTAADVGLRGRRLQFHVGSEPPRVQRYIADEQDH